MKIAPSLLSCDFSKMGEEIERMEKENASKPLDYDFLKEIEDE